MTGTSPHFWMGGSLLVALTALSLAAGGCTSGGACVPGSKLSCSCAASGSAGESVCGTNGEPGACSCDQSSSGGSSGAVSSSGGSSGGTTSSSGSSSGLSGSSSGSSGGTASSSGSGSSSGATGQEAGVPAGEGGTPGQAAFGASCTTAGDCSTDDCQLFAGMGGYYCTKPCQVDTDCPNPPNLGCNGMGYCKVP